MVYAFEKRYQSIPEVIRKTIVDQHIAPASFFLILILDASLVDTSHFF